MTLHPPFPFRIGTRAQCDANHHPVDGLQAASRWPYHLALACLIRENIRGASTFLIPGAPHTCRRETKEVRHVA